MATNYLLRALAFPTDAFSVSAAHRLSRFDELRGGIGPFAQFFMPFAFHVISGALAYLSVPSLVTGALTAFECAVA